VSQPRSPLAASTATPANEKSPLEMVPTGPEPLQLLEMIVAPSATALCSAASRSNNQELLASTSRMWQLGHSAETASMSRVSSSCQPPSVVSGKLEEPVSPTTRKQPLLAPHAGSPK
jgi:hypothetical protein